MKVKQLTSKLHTNKTNTRRQDSRNSRESQSSFSSYKYSDSMTIDNPTAQYQLRKLKPLRPKKSMLDTNLIRKEQ